MSDAPVSDATIGRLRANAARAVAEEERAVRRRELHPKSAFERVNALLGLRPGPLEDFAERLNLGDQLLDSRRHGSPRIGFATASPDTAPRSTANAKPGKSATGVDMFTNTDILYLGT